MNAVSAAVILALVAVCSGTAVYNTLGSQYYVPSSGYQYQYVQPQAAVQYVQQPYVAQSSVVANTLPYTYSNQVIPSVGSLGYTGYTGLAGYPYTYGSYGSYGLLKK